MRESRELTALRERLYKAVKHFEEVLKYVKLDIPCRAFNKFEEGVKEGKVIVYESVLKTLDRALYPTREI